MLSTTWELLGDSTRMSVCESADPALICRALLLVCCKSRAVQIGREDLPGGHGELWLQTASLLTASSPLLLSPHPQGWGGQGSAQVPSGDPVGSSRVLKAAGWDWKAVGTAGPQPEDQSQLSLGILALAQTHVLSSAPSPAHRGRGWFFPCDWVSGSAKPSLPLSCSA